MDTKQSKKTGGKATLAWILERLQEKDQVVCEKRKKHESRSKHTLVSKKLKVEESSLDNAELLLEVLGASEISSFDEARESFSSTSSLGSMDEWELPLHESTISDSINKCAK